MSAQAKAAAKRIRKVLKAPNDARKAKLIALYKLQPRDFLPQYGNWGARR